MRGQLCKSFPGAVSGGEKIGQKCQSIYFAGHTWTAWTSDGHPGKEYLDRFAYYMHATEPQMEWHVDYHPYSNPLYRNDFWNDWSSTSGSEYTSYISMTTCGC